MQKETGKNAREKKINIFVFIGFLLLVFLCGVSFAQDIFTDVPPDHWSRKTLQKLYEEGIIDSYPDKTFRGDQVVTRYEMAAALAKVFERIQGVETLLGGGTKTAGGEDKFKDLQKLLKEYEPELKALKKMEDKIKTFEKDFQKLEKESKKEKQETKKLITDLKKDLKSTQRDVRNLQLEQGRVTWSGSGSFSLSLTDNKAKHMEPLDLWGGGTCAKTTDNKGCGAVPPSSFDSDTGFELNLQASPRLSGKTDRIIKLRAEFRNLGRSLGTPVPNPSPTLNTFYVEYSAPRTKFTNLKVGDVSASWSILSLAITGVSFQGLRLSGVFGTKYQLEFVGTRIRKAEAYNATGGGSTPNCDNSSSCKFAEYLYGFTLRTIFGKTNSPVWFHYFKNWHDKDSLFFTEKVQKSYKPDETTVYSVFTRYPIMPPSMNFTGEIAWSNFKQWQKGIVVGTTPLDTGERKEDVPIKKESDTAILLGLDYNKRGFSSSVFYLRQNPLFHNRYGGPLALLGSFGGGLSFGGLDIASFLKGGIQALAAPNVSFTPTWAKGLTIKSLLAYVTEVTITPLTGLVDDLKSQFGGALPADFKPDTDLDRRSEKLTAFIMQPQFDYKPSFKTTFTLSYLYAKGGIPRHSVSGVGNLAAVDASGKGQSSTAIKVLPPIIPTSQSEINSVSSLKPAYFYPYFQYVNKNNDVITGVIYNDGGVRFFRNPDPAAIVKGDEIKTGGNLFDPSGNGTVYIDAANVPSLCGTDSSNCSYPTKDQVAPAEGSYVLYQIPNGPQRLLRITEKPIEMAFTLQQPSFKLTHKFSSKMTYELEGSQQIINIKTLTLPIGSFAPTFLIDTAKKLGLKKERTRSLNQHIAYQLFNNIGLDFYYNMTFNDYLADAGGHKEQTNNFRFTVSLNF